MNLEEIINLARQAECEETWGADAFRFGEVELERFATLVAAAEREACAKVCECDELLDYDPVVTANKCAAAIRARKENQ